MPDYFCNSFETKLPNSPKGRAGPDPILNLDFFFFFFQIGPINCVFYFMLCQTKP